MIDTPPPQLAGLSHAAHAAVVSHIGGPNAWLPEPAVAVTGPNQWTAHGAVGLAWHEQRRIDILNTETVRLVRLAGKPRWGHRDEQHTALLVHEHLHLMVPEWDPTPVSRAVDEAVVAAVTVDVLPRYVRAVTGQRSLVWATGQPPTLSGCVRRVRVASTVATGSRNWRAPAARAWRAGLVRSSVAVRAAAFVSVGMSPSDVCPEAAVN